MQDSKQKDKDKQIYRPPHLRKDVTQLPPTNSTQMGATRTRSTLDSTTRLDSSLLGSDSAQAPASVSSGSSLYGGISEESMTEKYSHMLELYDFPSSASTSQFSNLLPGLVDFQLLAATSAIVTFKTPTHARAVLKDKSLQSFFKARPFDPTLHADIQVSIAPAQRPIADLATAQRMITGALKIRKTSSSAGARSSQRSRHSKKQADPIIDQSAWDD